MTEPGDIRDLSQRIEYSFAGEELLMEALTHRSLHNERPKVAPRHNERLEFLGDAFIGAAVARMLYVAYPGEREGALTRRRAELVSETGLAEVARGLGLGQHLRLGKGEERSGGREKPRLLSSAFEALVGAVLIDGGEREAAALCERLFSARVAGAKGRRDAKSQVQERLQSEGRGTPRYEVLATEGPDHAREFTVGLLLKEVARSDDAEPEQPFAIGRGRSKAEAAQRAAESAMRMLAAVPERPGAQHGEDRDQGQQGADGVQGEGAV